MDIKTTKRVVSPRGPQGPLHRLDRLDRGFCPLHEDYRLEGDGALYVDAVGIPYAFASCSYPGCKVEAVVRPIKVELVPEWGFLLDQDEDGKGRVYNITTDKNC